MSDFDQNIMQNDLSNPFSPYNVNRPTVMDIVNNPDLYLNPGQSAGINQPTNPNNETIPKTNFFNKNAPDIKRNQPYDCFTIMHNNISKVKKAEAAKNILATMAIALGVALVSGKMPKLSKFKFSKLKLPKINLQKIKAPKIKMPKIKLPDKNTFSNLAKKIKSSSLSQKLAQYTQKAKNFITKKTT